MVPEVPFVLYLVSGFGGVYEGYVVILSNPGGYGHVCCESPLIGAAA